MTKYYFFDELEKEYFKKSENEVIQWAKDLEGVIEEEQAEEVNNVKDALRLLSDIHNIHEISQARYNQEKDMYK